MDMLTLISSLLNADFVDSDDDGGPSNAVHPPDLDGALPDVDQPPRVHLPSP